MSIIASCEQSVNNLDTSLSDQVQLIEAIQSSNNKSAVTIEELPISTTVALES